MVTVPAYTVGVTIVTVLALCLLTLWGGVTISNNNASRLLAKYEADKVAAEQANRGLYCELFQSQMNALDDAKSDAGKASYKAWLAVYRLVQCQPVR